MTGIPTGHEPEPDIEIDTSVAHPARVWDYWLGGKDHYPADEALGDHLNETMPEVVVWARADREFLGRAVRHLVAEAGLRQFLDIGTGIPTADNTHEVAQRLAPESRIVYVDNDPVVLAHARALLTSSPQGATDYVHADLRDPERILREAGRTLDLSRPVGIMLLGILEFLPDEQAYPVVRRLLDAVPSGSHLTIACPASDVNTEAMIEVVDRWNASGATPAVLRSAADLARFFDGMELLEPGVVPLPQWRPGPGTLFTDREIGFFGAVGRKP
ncbi:SAM-dependent methyltransferase [Thermomonospora cellulosilytica]|uniref:O-methyltransferase involved in polyketide biosynthesis n=1 Tax=Thermomonospora cellulosilytica TaxID=1411118 RepID=A0A7W3N126_9ACTN|nr:SAM-dependent methyltransferase [Thermomonospora cellulosilytica]MBA9005589.1 O-methyltransferase involved in polyketide biosynthesis [Thermomonospora cellulosilytica]